MPELLSPPNHYTDTDRIAKQNKLVKDGQKPPRNRYTKDYRALVRRKCKRKHAVLTRLATARTGNIEARDVEQN